MANAYAGKDIPGMIEPVEQEMLEHLASQIPFQPNDVAVEFGTFFGRSTACIAAGLSANKSFGSGNRFYAYDSFECDLGGGFYPHVLSFSERAGVSHLLERTGNKVNFFPVFSHYLEHYMAQGLLEPVREELAGSSPPGAMIGLMHIDSPKFYDEFKIILYRFFPQIRTGGFIVFQDFFYHWSASLIAVCACMIRMDYLSVVTSSASSLLCKVEKNFDFKGICEIDLCMQRESEVPGLIDYAREVVDKINIDRPDQFGPRLILAKMQWLYERGHHAAACDEILSYFKSGKKLNSPLLSDFLEMMRSGFSVRDLYQKDHAGKAAG